RRHTRSYGDWSSDVCSSDLPSGGVLLDYKTEAADAVGRANLFARWLPRPCEIALLPVLGELSARARPGVRSRFYSHAGILCGLRSEERRVGKECRSRGLSY